MKNKYHIMVAAIALATLITINLKAQDFGLFNRYHVDSALSKLTSRIDTTSLNWNLLVDTLTPSHGGYIINVEDTANVQDNMYYGGYFTDGPNVRAPWDTMRMGYYQDTIVFPTEKSYPYLEDDLLPSLIKRGNDAGGINNTNDATQHSEESIYDKILSSGNTCIVVLNPSSPPIIVVASKRKLKKLLRTFL